MSIEKNIDISFILNHLGEERSNYFDAISPPIIQSSNFHLKDIPTMRSAFSNEMKTHLYTRGNNPTVEILRKKLAALEHAEDALVFGSGIAAVAATFMNVLKSGDHVICVESPYSWAYFLLQSYLPNYNITTTFVDGKSTEAIENAILPNTKLLYLESPNTLVLELQDLEECAKIAKKYGLITAIDNSYCSPIYQRPLDFGIDIVMHSVTKYLNGHSDVLAGAICSTKAIIKSIFENEFMAFGGIISPNDAALVIRGLRTLPIRLDRSSQSTHKIVNWLSKHPKVRKIYYPFHPLNPQYELAKKQMTGSGGLFSVEFECDDLEKMEQFVHALRYFLIAVSWGGHESLMIPTCGFYNIPNKENPKLPLSFIRFYVGLEDPEILIKDIENALKLI